MNFEEKTNNEILIEMRTMQMDYDALKVRILSAVDMLENIEKNYAKAQKVMDSRLKK